MDVEAGSDAGSPSSEAVAITDIAEGMDAMGNATCTDRAPTTMAHVPISKECGVPALVGGAVMDFGGPANSSGTDGVHAAIFGGNGL